MTDPELQAIVRGLVPAVRELVTAALTPVVARLAAIEATPPARDGRDGQPGPPGPPGRDGTDGAAGGDGLPGRDGLGLDELTASYDGARGLTLTLRGGERAQVVALELPVPLYRGVWQKSAAYTRGDCVTFGGSLWHANGPAAPDTKPGDGSTTWQLAVKRGQDGRSA